MLAFVFIGAALVFAQHKGPTFNFHFYGNFKTKSIEEKLAGNVDLEQVLSSAHVYGVGIIKDAEGEITVYNGAIWLNYGRDGINVTQNKIPKGEKAAFLITAEVDKWQTIVVPQNMSEQELYGFIRGQAKNLGLNPKLPFPFLVEGNIKDLVWDVLDGLDIISGKNGNHYLLRKLVEYREATQATLVGFYPAELRNEFPTPGELMHINVLFKDEKITGHASTFSVAKGALLELPLK